MTDDALHHVERHIQWTVGVAEVKGPWNRDVRIRERGHHPIFTTHVMGGGQDVAQGRPPQDDLARVAGHAVGQIRLATRDERDVTVEPAGIVQDVGEHRSNDARVGAGRDPLEALRGRIVEVELLGGGHTATRDAAAANARPSCRSWCAASPNCCSRTMILRRNRWEGCSSVNAMPPNTCIEPCATSRAARETYAFATDAVWCAPGMPSSSAAAANSVVDQLLACLTWRSAIRCRKA